MSASTIERPDARARRLGIGIFASSSALIGAAFVLDLRTGAFSTLVYVAVAEALALIGLLLTTRMPRHPIAWVMAISASGEGIFSFSYAYAAEALVSDPGSLPGGIAAAWVDNWGWLPSLSLPTSALLLLMPDGRLASRRWWPVAVIVAAGTALGTFAVSSSRTFDLGTGPPIKNPLALTHVAVAVAGVAGAVLTVLGMIASVAAFVVRFRRATGEARQQLRWVGVSLSLAVGLGVVGALSWGVVPNAEALPALAALALPAGIAVAVLKYRLYDIDRLISRTISYAILTGLLVGLFVGIVVLMTDVLPFSSPIGVAASTLASAALFNPLRRRIQHAVDRRFNRARYDADAIVSAFTLRLRDAVDLDTVRNELLLAVEHAVEPAHASLWLRGTTKVRSR